ncbi:MAG TPA: NAD+ synthase [Coxiellaceae bacterium]|nr:MAG: NAD+ synthase [Gammaproteobacteria bacterium RIFCSPHIGHO2_12_FULL_36_30]HLB56919.1 NAD+ synthase [Coxiellaceae bacterium]
MKIALAQLNFLVGDIDGNADRIIQESKKISADLIVFPELALTGYPPEDLLFRPGFYKRCQRALHRIAENIGKKNIIIGYPESNHKTHYNKAALICDGKIIADYAKQELPNYTVFDEKRYFSAGDKSCVFELNNIKIGLVICEDLWHKNPVKQAKNDGAELIISINASPYDRKKVRERENTLKQRATENHIPIVYLNLVGGQDELVFDGGSMAVDANGDRCVQGKYYSEEIIIIDVELKNKKIIIEPQKLPERLPQEFHIYETLKLGVRDYIRKNNFPGALIGLSGGIDSALTLAIAADAIGAEKVTAVIMPSQFTAQMSIDDAIEEAKALGIEYHIIKIDELLAQFLKTLSPIFKNAAHDSTEENLQARIRGMLLMALSNKFGKIVLTTGNKSEMSVGYATLYGDMAGGFSVIKDVPKTLVYKLAHYRNKINKVIPDRVITRAPTAELKENQTDQDKLPPYDVLDEILERYIEKDEEPTQIVNAGFNKKTVDDVVHMINANEYKRRQAPIGIRLTQRAFGKDRRYPITSGYARSKK